MLTATPESLDEALRGEFCECNHPEHGNSKCYELDFNGTVYSACRCQRTNLEFCLVLTPMDFENVYRIPNNKRAVRRAA